MGTPDFPQYCVPTPIPVPGQNDDQANDGYPNNQNSTGHNRLNCLYLAADHLDVLVRNSQSPHNSVTKRKASCSSPLIRHSCNPSAKDGNGRNATMKNSSQRTGKRILILFPRSGFCCRTENHFFRCIGRLITTTKKSRQVRPTAYLEMETILTD